MFDLIDDLLSVFDILGEWGAIFKLVGRMCVFFIAIYVLVYGVPFLTVLSAVGGVAWGIGTAIYNYGQSFKENMIDSNKVTT